MKENYIADKALTGFKKRFIKIPLHLNAEEFSLN